MITIKAAFLICLVTNLVLLFLSSFLRNALCPNVGVVKVYQDEDGYHLFFETRMGVDELIRAGQVQVTVHQEILNPRS